MEALTNHVPRVTHSRPCETRWEYALPRSRTAASVIADDSVLKTPKQRHDRETHDIDRQAVDNRHIARQRVRTQAQSCRIGQLAATTMITKAKAGSV